MIQRMEDREENMQTRNFLKGENRSTEPKQSEIKHTQSF